MEYVLNVCIDLAQSSTAVYPCDPVSRQCPLYDGYDFRYLELIARIMKCSLNTTLLTDDMCPLNDIMKSGTTLIAIPLTIDNVPTNGGLVSLPVSILNMSFVYSKRALMDSPFWFHRPFSEQLWVVLLLFAVTFMPLFTTWLDFCDRDISTHFGATSMKEKLFRYSVGYMNQIPISFDSHKLLHGSWLMSVGLLVALYSSNIISIIVAAAPPKFRTARSVLLAIESGEYSMTVFVPVDAETIVKIMPPKDFASMMIGQFTPHGGILELAKKVLLRPGGTFDGNKVKIYYAKDKNMQDEFEQFFMGNKNTFVYMNSDSFSTVIDCGDVFDRLEFKSNSMRIFVLNSQINENMKFRINNAITATYDSEVYRVMLDNFVMRNKTTIQKYCGSRESGPIKLNWKNIEGLCIVCGVLLGFGVVAILVELFCHSTNFHLRRRFTIPISRTHC